MQVKEDLCYISKDFKNELLKSKRKPHTAVTLDSFGGNLKKYFALPDYQTIMKGFTKNDDAVIDPQEQVKDPHIALLTVFI